MFFFQFFYNSLNSSCCVRFQSISIVIWPKEEILFLRIVSAMGSSFLDTISFGTIDHPLIHIFYLSIFFIPASTTRAIDGVYARVANPHLCMFSTIKWFCQSKWLLKKLSLPYVTSVWTTPGSSVCNIVELVGYNFSKMN